MATATADLSFGMPASIESVRVSIEDPGSGGHHVPSFHPIYDIRWR